MTTNERARANSATRDGRAERSERTRLAVAEALLELIGEGDLQPTAPRIAERAGVALRTVFHHYEDMEALFAVASEMQGERMLALSPRVDLDAPLDARINELVVNRAALHEAVTPVRRAALLLEHSSPTIAARLAWTRERGRKEIASVFRRELEARPPADRKELTEALTCATSWAAWQSLRAHQGLTFTGAKKAMQRTVRALLAEDA